MTSNPEDAQVASATRYNMTPEDYRRRWGLAKDYPMVAPAYAAQRSTLAPANQFGRKPRC